MADDPHDVMQYMPVTRKTVWCPVCKRDAAAGSCICDDRIAGSMTVTILLAAVALILSLTVGAIVTMIP